MRKRTAALLGVAGTIGVLAARENWQRHVDLRRYEAGRDFWRLAFPAESVQWANAHLKTYRIPSGAVGVHLDVYAQDDVNAPVVVLAHGLVTYGRLYLHVIQALYARGYTLVCPDISGNGFSGGRRGDYTVGDATATLVDAAQWARQRFDGPLYLFGTSLGGAVAYAAAAAGAPVSAVTCIGLFTFDDRDALRQLIAHPALLDLLPLARVVSSLFGWVRLPLRWIQRTDHIVAPEERTQLATWERDPLLPQTITLGSLVSAATTPPAVPLERNTIPILVVNQGDDRVLNPAVTRTNFARLGGPKRYIELEGHAHWSFERDFWEEIVAAADDWFTAHSTKVNRTGHLTQSEAR